MRRMSIERLATLHRAVRLGPVAAGAPDVTLEDVQGIEVGDTFGQTYDLNRGHLDLFEEFPLFRLIKEA